MNEGFDENIVQKYDASCAIKCQQLILLDYGINVSESDLYRISIENDWCDISGGVFMRNNGKLLRGFDVTFHHSQGNCLENIHNELALGHQVMVNVNHAKLNGFEDINNQAGHAIIVNKITDDYIIVTDTGKGVYCRKIPKDVFLIAWKDSQNYMLSTDIKALYKYDPQTRSMIKM